VLDLHLILNFTETATSGKTHDITE